MPDVYEIWWWPQLAGAVDNYSAVFTGESFTEADAADHRVSELQSTADAADRTYTIRHVRHRNVDGEKAAIAYVAEKILDSSALSLDDKSAFRKSSSIKSAVDFLRERLRQSIELPVASAQLMEAYVYLDRVAQCVHLRSIFFNC